MVRLTSVPFTKTCTTGNGKVLIRVSVTDLDTEKIAYILFAKLPSADYRLSHTVSLRVTYDLSSSKLSLLWIFLVQQLRRSSLTTLPDLEMYRSTSAKPSNSSWDIRY